MQMLEQGIDDSDMVVVQGALMCLGQIGKQQFKSEEAIQILAKSLSSQNVALIFSASQALADIPNPLAEIDALRSLQNNNADPLIQEAAHPRICIGTTSESAQFKELDVPSSSYSFYSFVITSSAEVKTFYFVIFSTSRLRIM